MSNRNKNKAKSGRFKTPGIPSSTPSISQFFTETKPDSNTVVKGILNELIDNVLSCKLKKHDGDSVSNKTIQLWCNQFPWLEIVGDGRDRTLKCKVCTACKVKRVWSTEGSSNFQKNSVQRHNSSFEQSETQYSSSVATVDTESE